MCVCMLTRVVCVDTYVLGIDTMVSKRRARCTGICRCCGSPPPQRWANIISWEEHGDFSESCLPTRGGAVRPGFSEPQEMGPSVFPWGLLRGLPGGFPHPSGNLPGSCPLSRSLAALAPPVPTEAVAVSEQEAAKTYVPQDTQSVLFPCPASASCPLTR